MTREKGDNRVRGREVGVGLGGWRECADDVGGSVGVGGFRPAKGYNVSKLKAGMGGGGGGGGVGGAGSGTAWVLHSGEEECGGLVPASEGGGGFVTGSAILRHRRQQAHAAVWCCMCVLCVRCLRSEVCYGRYRLGLTDRVWS
jgi:hypothetical protein